MSPMFFLIKRALTEKNVARVEDALVKTLERGDTESAERLMGILARHEFRQKPRGAAAQRPLGHPMAMRLSRKAAPRGAGKGYGFEMAGVRDPGKKVEMGFQVQPLETRGGKTWRPLELKWLQSHGEGGGRHMIAYMRLMNRLDKLNERMKTRVVPWLEPGRTMQDPTGRGFQDALKTWSSVPVEQGGYTHMMIPKPEGPNAARMRTLIPKELLRATEEPLLITPQVRSMMQEAWPVTTEDVTPRLFRDVSGKALEQKGLSARAIEQAKRLAEGKPATKTQEVALELVKTVRKMPRWKQIALPLAAAGLLTGGVAVPIALAAGGKKKKERLARERERETRKAASFLVKTALSPGLIQKLQVGLRKALDRGDKRTANRIMGLLVRDRFVGGTNIGPARRAVMRTTHYSTRKGLGPVEMAFRGRHEPELQAFASFKTPELAGASHPWHSLPMSSVQSYGEGKGRFLRSYRDLIKKLDEVNALGGPPLIPWLTPGNRMADPSGKGFVNALPMWLGLPERHGGFTHFRRPGGSIKRLTGDLRKSLIEEEADVDLLRNVTGALGG